MFDQVAPHSILVIGSLVNDVSCTYTPFDSETEDPQCGSSNPATITQCVGGVAHNIALAASLLGSSVLLSSVIAKDQAGTMLFNTVHSEGLGTDGIIQLEPVDDSGQLNARTGQYVGNYNAKHELIFGMADVAIMKDKRLESQETWKALFDQAQPSIVVMDTTLPTALLDIVVELAKTRNAYTMIDLVSVPRAQAFAEMWPRYVQWNIVDSDPFDIRMILGNESEITRFLETLIERAGDADQRAELSEIKARLRMSNNDGNTTASTHTKSVHVPNMLATRGEEGCRYLGQRANSDVSVSAAPLSEDEEIVSPNGAGDSFVGTIVAALETYLKSKTIGASCGTGCAIQDIWKDKTLVKAMLEVGQRVAKKTLLSPDAVSRDIETSDMRSLIDSTVSHITK